MNQKCQICKEKDSEYLVVIMNQSEIYKYKRSFRCDLCMDIAKRSHTNIEITKLLE